MPKYITEEGLEKLKQELEYLKTVRQKEVAERLRKAIAFGDLSENFEYADAKEEQTMLQAKIAALEEEIREAKVVSPPTGGGAKSDRVQIGSIVEVEGAGKQTFTIVAANEADPMAGKISAESPIGACVIGKKVGEKCVAELPTGFIEYTIIKIQ